MHMGCLNSTLRENACIVKCNVSNNSTIIQNNWEENNPQRWHHSKIVLRYIPLFYTVIVLWILDCLYHTTPTRVTFHNLQHNREMDLTLYDETGLSSAKALGTRWYCSDIKQSYMCSRISFNIKLHKGPIVKWIRALSAFHQLSEWPGIESKYEMSW